MSRGNPINNKLQYTTIPIIIVL